MLLARPRAPTAPRRGQREDDMKDTKEPVVVTCEGNCRCGLGGYIGVTGRPGGLRAEVHHLYAADALRTAREGK